MPVDNASDPPAATGAHKAPAPCASRPWVSAGICLALAAVAVVLYVVVPWADVLLWTAQKQRDFQTAMAGSLRAIRGGDSPAILALCGATAAYGFVHALGPGHGKVLLGGAALASGATLRKMTVLTLTSSLAQAAAAIALVGAFAFALGWAARDVVGLTEAWLAPASALAIAAIGSLLVVRGLRAWPAGAREARHDHHAHDHAHHHDHDTCGCGHAHGPTASEVQSLTSTKEAVALVASIAMRPCTGALFVLVIALSMDVFWVGCLAVLTMGLGTAAFNLIVAASGVTARRLAALPLDSRAMRRFSAAVHIAGGAFIALLSGGLAWTYLDTPFALP